MTGDQIDDLATLMTGDQMKPREDPRGKEPREDPGDQMKTGGQLMTGEQIDDLATLMTGDQIDDLELLPLSCNLGRG